MRRMGQAVRWHLVPGASVTRDGMTITPLARQLTLRWPGGGIWWARPVGVIVRRDSTRRRVPLLDVTAALQLSIVILGALMLARTGRRRRTRDAQHDG